MCLALGLVSASAVLGTVSGLLPWMTTGWQCAATFGLKGVVTLQLLFSRFPGYRVHVHPEQEFFLSSLPFPGPPTSVEAPGAGEQAHYLVVSKVVGDWG